MRWLGSPHATTLVTGVIAVAVLYFAKPVLMPLAVAVLLSIVLAPTVRRIERIGVGRLRIGRIGAVAAVVLALGGGLAGVGWMVGVQGAALAEGLPQYRRNIVAHLRAPIDSLRELERTAREVRAMTQPPNLGPETPRVEVVDGGGSELAALASSWAGSVASLLGTAGLVVVLLVLLLVEREALRDRVIRVVTSNDYHVTTSALGDLVDRVTQYLRALALVNLGHGAVVAFGLFWLGLPGYLVFGLLAATLRFVPYLGPWVSASLPIALAVATSDGWRTPLEVGFLFVALELVSNNVVEPWLIGTSVGLSPSAMIVSAIFWAWLWGPVGLVIAAPITSCIVAFARYAPSLEPLAILLGNAEALSPPERLYQRLLARDSREATELVAQCTGSVGALQAWDDVVLPALRRLEWDRLQRRLDPEQLEDARETFDLLLAELPEPKSEPEGKQVPRGVVLCLPARGGWDEIVCGALERFLGAAGYSARAVAPGALVELASEVARGAPDAVCISSLASSAGPAHQLVMRIRRRNPETRLVVGFWGQGADPKFSESLGAQTPLHIVGRLEEVEKHLLDLLASEQAQAAT